MERGARVRRGRLAPQRHREQLWIAALGPFAEGDEVTYTVPGASPDGDVHTPAFAFRVKPALYIAWLWHQHQPLYRDPSAADAAGSYRAPWVRLHALRDYYSMAATGGGSMTCTSRSTSRRCCSARSMTTCCTAPRDAALDLTRQPAESLHRPQVDDVLSTFFDADWHHQIFVHRAIDSCSSSGWRGDRFSRQDLRDLQMWFNLAWFGHEFRTGARSAHHRGHGGRGALRPTAARVHPRGCGVDGRRSCPSCLRAVVPHSSRASGGRPDRSQYDSGVPPDLAAPNRTGPCLHRPPGCLYVHHGTPTPKTPRRSSTFARDPTTPHGSVATDRALAGRGCGVCRRRRAGRPRRLHVARHGCRRAGPFRPVGLSRVRPDGAVPTVPYGVRRQPSRCSSGTPTCPMASGSATGSTRTRTRRCSDFVRAVETKVVDRLAGDDDHVLTIVLDGENAWGGYPDDGRPFLHALYERLSSDRD